MSTSSSSIFQGFRPTYAQVVVLGKPKGFKPSYAQVVAQGKPKGFKPTYVQVVAQGEPKGFKPTYVQVIAQEKPKQSFSVPADLVSETTTRAIPVLKSFEEPGTSDRQASVSGDFLVKQTKCNWKRCLLASVPIISGIALAVFVRYY